MAPSLTWFIPIGTIPPMESLRETSANRLALAGTEHQLPLRMSLCVAAVLGGWAYPGLSADESVRFERDIRPIFSENCYTCHGPDEPKRKAKLRLDVPDGGVFETRRGFTPIVPGRPDESELFYLISSDDEEEVMPPPKTEKRLTAEEVALIQRWITQGAEWAGHWAYEPPHQAPVPEGTHPVDYFVRKRLAEEGLSASPPAESRTLLRRLSFDLSGLPPTAAEVAAFETHATTDRPEAVKAAVDRLLSHPRYGERMAVFWLDLVRYADSIGYHSDAPMDVYLYREWVIQAFNRNQPFDAFTRWQLAGDLLPDAGVEQKVASGYNRLLQTTEEGGAQPGEYVTIYAADRVRNLSGAWLGATLGCAQCHDHKFDPYTAKDFYAMAAFFADIAEKPVGARIPGMQVLDESHKLEKAELEARIASLAAATTNLTPALVAAQSAWEASLATSVKPSLGVWHLMGPFSGPGPGETFATSFGPEREFDSGLDIDGKTWEERKKFADGVVHPLPQDANSAWYLHRTIQTPQAAQLALSLGSDDGIRVWLNGEELLSNNTARGPAPDQERLTLSLQPGENQFLMKVVNHGGGAGFYFNVKGNDLPPTIAEILALPVDDRGDIQRDALGAYYLSIAPELAETRGRLEAAKQAMADFNKRVPRTLVAMSTAPRKTRILMRGNWLDDSGEVVMPAIPAFLGELDIGERRATRLDLANWVVDPDNPLTARSLVNRVWKLFFGAGLSRDVEDLGVQGQWPSHPELLDWLALDFVNNGWDVKRLVRLLVTSETYAMSSDSTAQSRDRDPLNTLLARQSRFRLDAEMVRDNALALGGILVEEIGGTSAKPYQPDGYWRHLNFPTRTYTADQDENQYRRALYTHWQRSFLHPSLLAFDAPSREECTAERPRSNTPLQALVLLNDPTYVEAARAFGERMLSEGGADPASRIRWAFAEALSRPPSHAELDVLAEFLIAQRARYQGDPDAAKDLLSVGLRPIPTDVPPGEMASWTAVARTILNLHETITRP